MKQLTDEVKRIIEDIRDDSLDEQDVLNALLTEDELWNSSETISALGGVTDLGLLPHLRSHLLEKAQKEFPEFFEGEDNDNNDVRVQ